MSASLQRDVLEFSTGLWAVFPSFWFALGSGGGGGGEGGGEGGRIRNSEWYQSSNNTVSNKPENAIKRVHTTCPTVL